MSACLFRSYENPKISDEKRIEQGSRNFCEAITRTLKGNLVLQLMYILTLIYKDGCGKGRELHHSTKGINCMRMQTSVA